MKTLMKPFRKSALAGIAAVLVLASGLSGCIIVPAGGGWGHGGGGWHHHR